MTAPLGKSPHVMSDMPPAAGAPGIGIIREHHARWQAAQVKQT
jgi:hypothetical protein